MKKNILFLFDVDGTLTEPRLKVKNNMLDFLKNLKQNAYIGIVGGSDLCKQKEQLGENVLQLFDYVFSENGLMAWKEGVLLGKESIQNYLGEDNIKKLINFVLRYIAELDIPIKRGTFIEFRNGMINISPIGRNCSKEERDEFEIYDKEHKIREKMINTLKDNFRFLDLVYSIGGQISFDVFPRGWDKTYCLKYISPNKFDEICFFGDKVEKGGNDYEIFIDSRVIGFSTTDPEKTIELVKSILDL